MLEDFRYLKSISGDAQPKMTIPSPSVLHFRGGRKDIDATVYPDLATTSTIWPPRRDAIRAFMTPAAAYLQLDDRVGLPVLRCPASAGTRARRGSDALARIMPGAEPALEGKPADRRWACTSVG